MNNQEKEILAAIKLGKDSMVFEYLYDHVFPKIKGFIKKSGGSKEDAKDLFQDAVMVFYKQVTLGKYNHQTEIDGYIFTVARNAWYTKMKRKKPLENIEDVREGSSDVTPELLINDKEREGIIMQLFDELGERCKELMINMIYYDLSLKELVEKMGFKTIDAVKTKNYKCKQRLIKMVKGSKNIRELLQY